MKHKYICLIALLSSVWANGQQATGVGAVPYLLRMERLRSDQDVCVLVQRNGQYHLERLHRYGIRVFEGKLPNGDLTALEELLTKDQFFRLQQSDIGLPLIAGDLDQLFVSVLRPTRWQNLEFDSVESRKPYEELLNPLLKWLDDIQKEKAKELTEESGRNNCLPPKEIQLQMRTGEKIFSNTQAPAVKSAYILRTITRYFDPSRIENSCVLIKDTGVYHVRRSQKLNRKETKTSVIDGKLSAEALNSLRVLIDADELRRWPSEKPPLAPLRAATVTSLSIPREGDVQQIAVWQYVIAPAYNLGSIGGSYLPGVDDHGTKLIRPLNDWMKTNIPREKEIPTSDPANPQCLPEP